MKRRSYKSLAQLEKDYKKAMLEVIQTEVRKVITDEWLEEMERRVYGVYTPKEYIRRKKDGGLSDPDNIKHIISVASNTIYMEMANVTGGNESQNDKFKHNPVSSSTPINTRIESEYDFDRGSDGPIPARPYTEYAVADLVSGISRDTLEYAILLGLVKRGFNVKLY